MRANVALVIKIVGVVLALSVAGIITLAVLSKPIPDVLQNVAVGSLTGLVGLMVQSKEETA